MKRKLLTATTAAFVSVSSLFLGAGNIAYANQEIDSKINDIKEKRSVITEDITKNKQEIERLQTEQKKTEEEMRRLDTAIGETNEQIRDREAEIAQTNEELAALEAEIAILKERIEKRNELLKERARSLQESGGMVDYMDVVLGAQSFSDFVSRISAVTTIVQADRDLLIQHEADKRDKKQKEEEVQVKLQSLEKALKELEELRSKLETQVEEKTVLLSSLKEEEKHAEDEVIGLQEEAAILADQEKAAQAEKLAWEQEQRELAERKKREEAAAKVAEAKKKAEQSTQSAPTPSAKPAPSTTSTSSTVAGSKPQVTSGAFMRPANGPVTSRYGYRPQFGRMHYGIDIGKRGASVPIVSVAEGTVFRAYYSTSYGNVVFVRHNINGQTWVSIYAHLENYSVSPGQSVSKGQFLGYMGNTGRSFGAHLHFELHKGNWNGSSSAVNPEHYIKF